MSSCVRVNVVRSRRCLRWFAKNKISKGKIVHQTSNTAEEKESLKLIVCDKNGFSCLDAGLLFRDVAKYFESFSYHIFFLCSFLFLTAIPNKHTYSVVDKVISHINPNISTGAKNICCKNSFISLKNETSMSSNIRFASVHKFQAGIYTRQQKLKLSKLKR